LTMKQPMTFALLTTMLIASVSAQDIKPVRLPRIVPEAQAKVSSHTLSPGSKGNKLILNLTSQQTSMGSNTSTQGSDSLMVWLVSRKSTGDQTPTVINGLSVTPGMQVVVTPTTKANTEVEFLIDVSKDVNPKLVDTLKFLIVGRGGALVRKTVLINYLLPATYQLDQNFPNPFNPSTTINYQLPVDSKVELKLFDVLGREVRTLINEQQGAGYHQVVFNASGLASGMYAYRIEASSINGQRAFQQVRKMLLLK